MWLELYLKTSGNKFSNNLLQLPADEFKQILSFTANFYSIGINLHLIINIELFKTEKNYFSKNPSASAFFDKTITIFIGSLHNKREK